MKRVYLITLAIIAATVLVGSAMASQPVPATVGVAIIASSTSVQATGNVVQTDTLTWIQDSKPDDGPPLDSALRRGWGFASTSASTGFFSPTTPIEAILALLGTALHDNGQEVGEVRYTAGYTAANRMVQGTTVLTKAFSADSRDQIADHNNIQATTLLTFAAQNEAGQAVGSEDILVDGAGAVRDAAAATYSPFGPANNYYPPFAITSNAGSAYNLLLGTVDTAAGERFIAASVDVPVSQTYSITGRGITSASGTAPAIGSLSAFMNARVQEGRVVRALWPWGAEVTTPGFFPGAPAPIWESGLASDITYAQTISAGGSITSFGQAYSFTGVR